MAWVDVVSYADLGAPRWANHRRSNDLFRDRDDRRLDQSRRVIGIARDAETAERGRLRRHNPGWPARPGDDSEHRDRQYRPSRRRILATWDRFHLALPFGRGVYLFGEPIEIAAELDEEGLEGGRRLLET